LTILLNTLYKERRNTERDGENSRAESMEIGLVQDTYSLPIALICHKPCNLPI